MGQSGAHWGGRGDHSFTSGGLGKRCLCSAWGASWRAGLINRRHEVQSESVTAMRNGEIIAVYRHEMEAALNWHGDDTVDVVANETWHVGVHPHFNSRLQ
eukprot:EG_transcript_31630